PLAVRAACADQHADHQRSRRSEPRLLRHQQQAAGNDRVGVSRRVKAMCSPRLICWVLPRIEWPPIPKRVSQWLWVARSEPQRWAWAAEIDIEPMNHSMIIQQFPSSRPSFLRDVPPEQGHATQRISVRTRSNETPDSR